jgi:hypothetical protein
MMSHPFPLTDLFLPAALIFLFTAGVALFVTRAVGWSLASAFFKAGLFILYFGYVFHGEYSHQDDITYLNQAALFAANGVTVWNIFEHLPLILATAGNHFIYQIFCTYALYFFGPGYFAPVALNTLLSPLIAALGCKIAEVEFGFTGPWRAIIFFILLFDPTISAWAGFYNGKDVLVLFGHVVTLYGFMLLYRGQALRAIGLLGSAASFLFFLRFYVPLLFIAAFMLSIFLGAGRRHFGRLLLAGGAGFAGILAVIGPETVLSNLAKLRSDFVNPAYGLIRFLLTPIPFNADADYRFLEIPAVLSWLFLPLLIWGTILVARLRTPFSKFFLLYCLVFAGLYSTFAELQGPRHRLQLEFAIVIFEMLALRALMRSAMKPGMIRSDSAITLASDSG